MTPPTDTQTKTNYLPALDGLRAISILLVVFSHANLSHVVPGGLGVLIFFVISGFLITRQIIAEIENTGTLNLKNFYLRRFFRLAPALLAYIALFTPILLALGSTITFTHLLSGIFYFANYYFIFFDYPIHNPMPILWSLSVEEHYYLLFPFLILLFRKNLKAAIPWLVTTTLAVLVWRTILFTTCADSPWAACGLPGQIRIHGTDAIVDCIIYGALAALTLHYDRDRIRRFLINQTAFAIAFAILLITLIYRDPLFRETIRFSLQSISAAIIMLNILFGEWKLPNAILSKNFFVQIGRISYSLYLFHFGVLITIQAINHETRFQNPLEFVQYFIFSFALAMASYLFIEKPMIKLRKKFGARAS